MQQRPGVPAAEPDRTLADRVRRAALDRPDRPALIWYDRTITWSELDDAVDRVAAALAAHAPPTGDHPARIAVALPNSPDFAVAFFAILRAGLVAVPVNPGFTPPELRHVLSDSGASVLIGTDRVCDVVAGLRSELPALTTVLGSLPTGVDGVRAEPVPVDREALALLLYTSGTEGRPKGAMLSHRALLANHEQIDRIEPTVLGSDDTALLALPFFHAYGLNSGLGAVAYHGACGVLVERFDPGEALSVIARHQVTVLVGVPSMFLGWSLLPDLDEAMATVRVAVCGAAPLENSTASRFTEATRHPVFVGYGLTETAPVLTSTLVSPVAKAGSIGRAIPGVEVRLVAAAGETVWAGADTGPGYDDPDEPYLDLESAGTDPGEIVVRGANLFSGYWPDGRGGPDPAGWWATGDIAYADADGDLFLVDRLGELILVNGFNVYPHEVELAIEAHPGIAESAVVGIPHPYTGQTVKAYAVRVPGAAVGAEELLEHCERNLARFKCPTAVEFVAELPHSAIGKVRKTMLRTGTTGAPGPAGDPGPADAPAMPVGGPATEPTEVPDAR
ncbi:AMP-binding protein [Micromonospora zhanjiangensis]|uniref:AMP-binding protein n=1 Tax=Micromonospora zhanjiangensis TaxID=1522057 RepID=A0ABV8KFA9_9ACTN